MKKIISLNETEAELPVRQFIGNLVRSYIEELEHHTEWFNDDIPMVNYGERCQVGFMAMGLSLPEFRDKYAVIQEFRSSTVNLYPDLGVITKNESKKPYFIVEAKYYADDSINYSILEYDQPYFDTIFGLGSDQLKLYYLADKDFSDLHNAIGISIILHPFFHDKLKPSLSSYSDQNKWNDINSSNFAPNYNCIIDSTDMYYFLYEVEHNSKENSEKQIVGFEIFGKIVTLKVD